MKSVFAVSLFLIFCQLLSTATPVFACSAFNYEIQGRSLLGRNYDFNVGTGFTAINKRGVVKKAGSFRGTEFGSSSRPLVWESTYASITFNQGGLGFPVGGMNEKGLVVEYLGFDDAIYSKPDKRPVLETMQWVQYQLDKSATIEEVIAGDKKIRIRPSMLRGHFFVREVSGRCAVIEYIDQKMVHFTDSTLPVTALTNTAYTNLLTYYEKRQIPERDLYQSVERFFHLADSIAQARKITFADPVKETFEILKGAAHIAFPTQWRIVYDPSNLRVYFQTKLNSNIRSLDLSTFQYSCSTPAMVKDLNTGPAGDISHDFETYSTEFNRKIILAFYKNLRFYTPPDQVMNRMAEYPETMACKNQD